MIASKHASPVVESGFCEDHTLRFENAQFHPESVSSENVQFSLYSLSKSKCVLLASLCRSEVCCSREPCVCVWGGEALISGSDV